MAKNIFENFDFEGYRALLEAAKEDEIHIVHTFDPEYHLGGFTIAWQRDTDYKGKYCNKMVNVAISYCSDKDYFSRKIGAYNALTNAYTGRFIQVPVGNEDSGIIVETLREMFGSY